MFSQLYKNWATDAAKIARAKCCKENGVVEPCIGNCMDEEVDTIGPRLEYAFQICSKFQETIIQCGQSGNYDR